MKKMYVFIIIYFFGQNCMSSGESIGLTFNPELVAELEHGIAQLLALSLYKRLQEADSSVRSLEAEGDRLLERLKAAQAENEKLTKEASQKGSCKKKKKQKRRYDDRLGGDKKRPCLNSVVKKKREDRK